MGYPSIKTLTAAFGAEKARKIRAIMLEPSDRMDRINEMLGTFGIEYIRQGHNQKSPAISYCNTGDPYRTTVMRVNGQFRVGNWGDIIERGHYD